MSTVEVPMTVGKWVECDVADDWERVLIQHRVKPGETHRPGHHSFSRESADVDLDKGMVIVYIRCGSNGRRDPMNWAPLERCKFVKWVEQEEMIEIQELE